MASDQFSLQFRRFEGFAEAVPGLGDRLRDKLVPLPLGNVGAPAPSPQQQEEQRRARAVIDEVMRMSVSDWGSDDFVRDRVTPEVLKYASPAEKAHMLRCLMDGPTGGDDEQAMVKVLNSVGSADELAQVLAAAGGAPGVIDELEGNAAGFINGLKGRGEEGAKMILTIARGYPVTHGASDDFVRNHVDAGVLAFATDDDRAHMLRCLMDGWTVAGDEQAMLRILQSARDPESVRQTVAKAGGAKAVLGELESSQGAFIAHLKAMGPEGNRVVAELALGLGTSDLASDDFVRAHVDEAVLARCSPEEKVQLLKSLLDGFTGIDDERAILRILDSAGSPAELKILLEGAGKANLARDIDDAAIRRIVETKIFEVESADAPAYRPLPADASEADIDARLAELEAFLREREARYDDLDGNWLSGLDQSDRFTRFYSDLKGTVREDLANLAGRGSMTRDEKLALYNRVAHEAHVELQHNVNLTVGDKAWSNDEIRAIDEGLEKLPPAMVLENEKLYNIRRFANLGDKGDVAAWALPSGDIEFSDIGVGGPYRLTDKGVHPVTETIIHEIGHHYDDENPRWKEFMAIAGWQVLGTEDSADLAKFETGKTYKGKDLGLADADGDYVVKRRYGNTYVHKPNNSTFGVGDYTQNNPLDDFAESLAQFFLDPERFRTLAPDKYQFMKDFTGKDPARDAEISRLGEGLGGGGGGGLPRGPARGRDFAF